VLEVINVGAAVTDVARRIGVSRQTVHVWPHESVLRYPTLEHQAMICFVSALAKAWRGSYARWGK